MYFSLDSTRIRNLKLISKLKIGDKLCTRYHHYKIDTYSPFSLSTITRMVYGESRMETLESITQLVESCISQQGVSDDERVRLASQFKEVGVGLDNLMVTYKDDSATCVGLEFVKEMLNEYIDKHHIYKKEEDSVAQEDSYLSKESDDCETSTD